MKQQTNLLAIVFVTMTMILATANAGSRDAYNYSGYRILPAYVHYDPQKLREVQIALRHLGYYSGVADGFMGYGTDLAISRFQLDHQHPVRAVVDQWLLVNLGIVRPVEDKAGPKSS